MGAEERVIPEGIRVQGTDKMDVWIVSRHLQAGVGVLETWALVLEAP